MLLLILFSFLGGVVTILSPCILPILPIVLSGSVDKGKRKPMGIVAGFIFSFTFFTLFLSTIVKATGISADSLRSVSIFILIGFGLSLLLPQLQEKVERIFSRLSGRVSTDNRKEGFSGGFLIGLSLGLVWTPCVGPILASIITLAATSSVNFSATLITLAYSLGTAIPMIAIMYGGRTLLNRLPFLTQNATKIQKAFGVLMIITAIGIFFNIDRKFQAYILEKFPQYGVGLTKLEDNALVKEQLNKLKSDDISNILDDLSDGFYPVAPELIAGGEWFNSKPLKLSELKGKVVLLDIWTYTCINCIRTLPYLKSWHEKYKDKGLVMIGVHTPEFEFEKNPDNVAKAIDDFGIAYPVMQDNDYATWRAYNNRYWPAKYFIDRDGRVRSSHFGEGDYDESELLIQQLLKEAGSLESDMPVDNPKYDVQTRTPETYLGYGRIDNFASIDPIKEDRLFEYSDPDRLNPNDFSFNGKWTVTEERAQPEQGATLTMDFDSKDVFLVMGSKNKIKGKVKIYLDGKLFNQIEVDQYRLYDIFKLSEPGRHVLKLEFQDSNLELYAFTFG